MIEIAHNIEKPYQMSGLKVKKVTKAELAGILGTLAKTHGVVGQWPNNNPNIIGYIFFDGVAVNVRHQ